MLKELLFVIFIIISLGGGLWAVVLTNRLKEIHKLDYLTSYLYYEILLFIFGIYGLIGMAVVTWILQEMETPISTVDTIASLIPLIGIPFVIAAWYIFVKMSFEIVGKTVSAGMTITYFVFMLIVILSYGYLVVYLFRSKSENAQSISDMAKYVFVAIESITLAIALYMLFVKGAKVKHKRRQHAIRNFAKIYLAISIIRITLFLFADRDPVFAGAYILVFFAGDIPAILFLGNYLNKDFLTNSEDTTIQHPFNYFITNYGISKREWEIVEKICEGMTNKEISETLFISLQTVKDHSHRIYKKTGVKNRVQLSNLISDFESQ